MTIDAARTRRTPAGVIGDVLLWVASIGGVICILVVIAAVFFHVTLIMFKTGSMEPTIPTGIAGRRPRDPGLRGRGR